MSRTQAKYWTAVCMLVGAGFILGQFAAISIAALVAAYLVHKNMERLHDRLGGSSISGPQTLG